MTFLSHSDGTERVVWRGPARHVTVRIATEVLEERAGPSSAISLRCH